VSKEPRESWTISSGSILERSSQVQKASERKADDIGKLRCIGQICGASGIKEIREFLYERTPEY
jgi:hypothetical protein